MIPLPRCFAALAFFVLLSHIARAQPQDIVPVRSGSAMQSLNGDWQFKYVAGSDIGADVAFSNSEFGDAQTWKSTPVPSHWELHGFAEPKYAKVDDGTGLYRRTFRVPSSWKGQRVFLRFEGVLYGFEAWVNGRSVGTWASAYNPVSFNVTDALKSSGEDNVLAVRVTTRSKGYEFDTNDCWALSGIYRDVALFAVPTLHFQDYTTRTTLAANGSAELNVDVVATGAGAVVGKLIPPTGRPVQEFKIALGAEGRGTTAIKVTQPKLWTAETPALYRLEMTLQSEGKTVQQLTEKIGLRQITIDDGILKLNGTAIKLRGVDHHDIWPDEGRVATEELMRRDLTLMQAANINFIRTSHYPPHPRFIELCDELGFYVMDEVPFGFGDEHLKDESYQEILLTRARATVTRDKNRPSVIVWSVGNENPNTPLTFATGKRVKELDPTRPICFPQVGSYFERSHQELPEWVDIYAPHYPVVRTLQRYATELKRPIIVTEYAHALGLASDRIQEEWELMQTYPHFAGGAVWMFQDQGIRRTASQPTDLATPSLYAWPDATHYYDTSGNGGMDGIVYSDRTPQTDYWETRKVYAPVQIAEHELEATTGLQKFPVHIENRFDFRPLVGFQLAWSLQKNGATVQRGSIPLTAAAHGKEVVTIPVSIPEDFAVNFCSLELRCLDEAGKAVTEWRLRVEPAAKNTATKDLLAELGSAQPGPLNFAETPQEIRVTHPRFVLTVDRQTGALAIRDPQGAILAEGGYPHVGRRLTEAESLRAKTAPIWTGAFLAHPQNLETEVAKLGNGVGVRVHGKYPRAGAPNQFLEGDLNLVITPDGSISVDYSYTPVNATGALLEAGLSFVVPPTSGEFRWVGRGPFPEYPDKDRLNEFGLYHLNRDDLNFQGNRSEIEVAALTNQTGAGLLLAMEWSQLGTEQRTNGRAFTHNGSANLAVENTPEGIVLSHNAIVSGRGNKGVGPESSLKAEDVKEISGSFALVPLGTSWPASVTRWFGKPTETVPVLRPFFRSYDQ